MRNCDIAITKPVCLRYVPPQTAQQFVFVILLYIWYNSFDSQIDAKEELSQ